MERFDNLPEEIRHELEECPGLRNACWDALTDMASSPGTVQPVSRILRVCKNKDCRVGTLYEGGAIKVEIPKDANHIEAEIVFDHLVTSDVYTAPCITSNNP